MTFVIADRVKESTATTGNGSIALGGAATGCRAFSAVCANNDQVPYTISSAGGSEWEVGIGIWATGNTLARTLVIASSNANALVVFSAGTKDVYLDVVADLIRTNVKVCDGRLTLTTGVPVTTADVAAATNIYFTPMVGNEIALPLVAGGAWGICRFSELTLAVGATGGAAGTAYDVFAYLSAGAVALARGPAWSSSGALGPASRGAGAGTTELVRQDGIWVNAVAISGGPAAKMGRYLGSFAVDTGGASVTDSIAKRFLFNQYNRRPRALRAIDTTDSWSYTTDTVRLANGASTNAVNYLAGIADVLLRARVHATVFVGGNSARAAKVGVGVNSFTAFNAASLVPGGYNSPNGTQVPTGYFAMVASYEDYPLLGSNVVTWLEKGADGTCVFLGDNGGDGQQCGLTATVDI